MALSATFWRADNASFVAYVFDTEAVMESEVCFRLDWVA